MTATRKFEFDTGNSAMNSDHQTLVELLEELEHVCKYSVSDACQCKQCPGERMLACHAMLRTLCGRMQLLLLEHFEREHELMNMLPLTPRTRSHCARHRREHVNFSTRYNTAAKRLQGCEPAIGAREMEALVIDWVRGHALEYDMELSSLLKA